MVASDKLVNEAVLLKADTEKPLGDHINTN